MRAGGITTMAAVLTHAATGAWAQAPGAALIGADWETVLAEAEGDEVNFFLWGGSDRINAYVETYVAGRLAEEHGIALNRVGISDTAEAVAIVAGEAAAGIEAGSVDLVWINGENFRTMRQGDLALCGYTGLLPNGDLIDWEDPSVAFDFGVPVEGCEVPWNRAQFAFAHDPARGTEAPGDLAALLDWIRANPGRFTYPAPPDFNGSAFVRHVFVHAAGGVDRLLGPFDAELYEEVAAETWAILDDLEPHLWREGRTYPTSITALDDLFANSEVDFTFNYDPAQFGLAVEAGRFADSVRSFGLTSGTIANTNYLLIPANAANPAAAMVAQDVMLSAAAQLEKARPEVWGAAPGIDVSATPAEVQAAFAALPRHPAVIAPEVLAEHALPELQADWIAAIEEGWRDNVGR